LKTPSLRCHLGGLLSLLVELFLRLQKRMKKATRTLKLMKRQTRGLPNPTCLFLHLHHEEPVWLSLIAAALRTRRTVMATVQRTIHLRCLFCIASQWKYFLLALFLLDLFRNHLH